ncbi:hypothetical protein MSG37_13270 [Shewanella sp. 1CM18E]|uniref:hypothetical protein n=1 Tax=Shewanella sp. 1CM18E TaxID=2929169 RepID=UPI0020C03387|nr:hypothetical protein [Shewanella sp. 1CM18E]MCK8045854.1 hypothetical protein [Shewanella sp. 1CM18E]
MNYSTTKIAFSGRMALLAIILSAFAFVGQANAEEFTAKEKAAIAEHHQIIENQMAKTENELEATLQSEFDAQVKDSEQEFMQLACTAHGLDFDNSIGVCFE